MIIPIFNNGLRLLNESIITLQDLDKLHADDEVENTIEADIQQFRTQNLEDVMEAEIAAYRKERA